jgi:hypothetical protein
MNLSGAEKKRALFIIIIAAACLYGIVTMQLLLAIVIIVIAILGLLVWNYLGTKKSETAIEQGEGEAILGAGLITLVAMANMEWVVWGIGLAFIFMVHQSLARIEKRMDALEKRDNPLE